MPWSPLGGGLRTGKYNRNDPPPLDSRFGGGLFSALHLPRRWQERVFDVTEGLAPLAEAKGCSLSADFGPHPHRFI
ncbi:MAG TPA: hypothetical protein VER55_16330 [Ardenticatenaceae bacterium]|nr:hypothetical protein [Ardenticatenaceae bacterium]